MLQGKLLGLAESRVFTTLLGRVSILRRQDMNSKSGEEQKKGHHLRKSPNFESKSGAEQKKGQNDNALILGRVLGLDLAHSYWSLLQVKIMHYIGLSMQRKIALYVSFFKLCY